MNAKLRLLDAMLAIALQLTKSPDREISAAATDELTVLSQRRARLLKQQNGAGQGPESPNAPEAHAQAVLAA